MTANLTLTLSRRPFWQWPWFALRGFRRRYRELAYRGYSRRARVFLAAYQGVCTIAK